MKLLLVLLSVCSITSCTIDSDKKDVIVSKEIKTPWIVEIFGEQFKWSIRYSGEDNVLGKFDYKLINETNPLGLMTTESIETRSLEVEGELNHMDSVSLHMEITEKFTEKQKAYQRIQRLLELMRDKHDKRVDEIALNDMIITDTFVLCVNKEYEFHFRSKDVIHSAYFPHFRSQMNLVPGMTTRFNFTPKETTKARRKKENDDAFDFMLMCNKICGAGHYSMKIVVRVVEIEEYANWMKYKRMNLFRNLTKS